MPAPLAASHMCRKCIVGVRLCAIHSVSANKIRQGQETFPERFHVSHGCDKAWLEARQVTLYVESCGTKRKPDPINFQGNSALGVFQQIMIRSATGRPTTFMPSSRHCITSQSVLQCGHIEFGMRQSSRGSSPNSWCLAPSQEHSSR